MNYSIKFESLKSKSLKKINPRLQNIEKFYKKSKKLRYLSPYFWKKTFLFQQSFAFKYSEKFIYSRSSNIPYSFIRLYVEIHSGRRWYGRVIHRWNVGFKFGELTWNRKLAKYKAKQLRKKKKK